MGKTIGFYVFIHGDDLQVLLQGHQQTNLPPGDKPLVSAARSSEPTRQRSLQNQTFVSVDGFYILRSTHAVDAAPLSVFMRIT